MHDSNAQPVVEPAGCDECPLHSRRDFLRDAAAGVAAALGLTGLAASPILAQVEPIAALAAAGTERRYAIPATDAVQVDAENDVILARAAGHVYAFALACPHQRTALRWEAANNRFRCPKHKSTFRPDGTFIEGKATRPMDRHAIRRDGDAAVVNLDVVHRFDKAPAEWEAAVVKA